MKFGVRNEMFISSGLQKTVGEKWNSGARHGHWYSASTEYAVRHLGAGNGRACLVIGSPIFEANSLAGLGWSVTYLDIRVPPFKPWKFIQGDAMEIPLPDESFDAVSSACVLTHAGTGRYGDGINNEHGDEAMLSEVIRVLKKGAPAVLTFGACADMEQMVRMPAHRIYTVAECQRMLAAVALEVLEMKIWSCGTKAWLPEGELPTKNMSAPDYISFAVRKPCGS